MNPTPPARSFKDYFLPFLIILSIGIIAVLSVRMWGLVENEEGGSLSLSGKAELMEISGEVEVYLPAAQAWKITNETTSLNAGESVRTSSESDATLEFDDGSVLTLANSSELKIVELQNSISKKEIKLTLQKGSVGIVVGTMNANFEISGNFLKIQDADGKFLLNLNEEKNTVTAIEGGFTAVVLDAKNSKNPELKNFVVETGETLEISERRINLLRIGGEIDLVKTTPDEIKHSKIYLAMTEGILEDVENLENPEINESGENNQEVLANLSAPLIVTGDGDISAAIDPVRITGKVSPEIVKVEVAFENAKAFALSQFKEGGGKWSYNASRSFGNLKAGANNYTVVGYDVEGNKTPPASFRITFSPEEKDSTTEEPKESEEPESQPVASDQTDGVPAVGGEAFGSPEVTGPQDGATFTEAPINFAGKVPANTEVVFINEYKLSSFQSGSTSWIYNAHPKYENLSKGENEYEIVAVSENGDRSSITIKINYSPTAEE